MRLVLYAQVLEQAPQPAARLDELRPYAQDRRAAGRGGGGLPRGDRLLPDAGRGVVEPGQPQDGQVQRRRYRRDGGCAGGRARWPRKTASTSTSRWARRWRIAGQAEPAFAHYAAGNALRRARTGLRCRRDHTVRRPRYRAVHARILRRARRAGLRCGRSGVHPGHAARRIDAGRTDPVQPQPGRRDQRTARHSGAGAARCRAIPKVWPGSRPNSWPRWARNTSSAPGSSARPSGRCSSTSCPTTGAHVPFIHLILPNATIIDARRHPLGCCFSNFKQHFARGQAFSYGLEDMGRYYADYVRLMAHIDRGAAGRGSTGSATSAWSMIPRPKCARCWPIAGWSSNRPAWRSMKPNAPSAPPAANRSASRSSVRDRGLEAVRALSSTR